MGILLSLSYSIFSSSTCPSKSQFLHYLAFILDSGTEIAQFILYRYYDQVFEVTAEPEKSSYSYSMTVWWGSQSRSRPSEYFRFSLPGTLRTTVLALVGRGSSLPDYLRNCRPYRLEVRQGSSVSAKMFAKRPPYNCYYSSSNDIINIILICIQNYLEIKPFLKINFSLD